MASYGKNLGGPGVSEARYLGIEVASGISH